MGAYFHEYSAVLQPPMAHVGNGSREDSARGHSLNIEMEEYLLGVLFGGIRDSDREFGKSCSELRRRGGSR